MYVTDVPVVDRLTDRTLGPILSAARALDGALDDLAGYSEEAEEKLFPTSEPSRWAMTSEAVAKGLSEATDAALAAHLELYDALHLLRPESL